MNGDKKRKLPEGWRWGKIKDVIENNIQVFSPENYDEEKFIYIDISSVDNVRKKFLNTNQVLVKDAPNRAKSILKENDIIISTVRPNLNTVALVDKSREGNICSSGFCVIRLKNGYHAPYFFYYLTSPYFVEAVSNMVQGAMYPAISNDDVKFFSIPFPSLLSDQLAIASDLERRMAHVEKMRAAALRQKEAIAAMQGAILREAFSYKEGDELPEGWKLRPLKENCFINPSKRKGFTREPNAQTSFVPMEAVDEETGKIAHIINRNYFEISKGYTFFEDGDVLFAKITPCMQNGKSAIAQDLIDGVGFGSTEFHVLRPKKDVTKEWIYFYIRTVEFRKRAKDHFEGSAGQQRVSTDFIENSLIPLPPTLSDQIAIVAEFERKMAELEKARQAAGRQLEAIKMLPGAILREVFDFQEENTGS